MNWGELAHLIRFVAPEAEILATAIGGPFGGIAATLLSSAMGVAPDPQSLATAIQNDPNPVFTLQQAQMTHQENLVALNNQAVNNARRANDTLPKLKIAIYIMTFIIMILSVTHPKFHDFGAMAAAFLWGE